MLFSRLALRRQPSHPFPRPLTGKIQYSRPLQAMRPSPIRWQLPCSTAPCYLATHRSSRTPAPLSHTPFSRVAGAWRPMRVSGVCRSCSRAPTARDAAKYWLVCQRGSADASTWEYVTPGWRVVTARQGTVNTTAAPVFQTVSMHDVTTLGRGYGPTAPLRGGHTSLPSPSLN